MIGDLLAGSTVVSIARRLASPAQRRRSPMELACLRCSSWPRMRWCWSRTCG